MSAVCMREGSAANPPNGGALVRFIRRRPLRPFRFALGWSCNRTGSLFLVGLLHAARNAMTGGDGFDAGYLRNLYPHDTHVTMAHLMTMFLLDPLVVIATRGRLGHRTSGGPPVERFQGVGSASPGTAEES